MSLKYKNISVKKAFVTKVKNNNFKEVEDIVVDESALEISLEFGKQFSRAKQNIALTMRTAGNDKLLAKGFLFSEGVIKNENDILEIESNAVNENKIVVKLKQNVVFDINNLSRHLFTSSSCGVCGKTSIDNLVKPTNKIADEDDFKIDFKTIYSLKEKMFQSQNLFSKTGGNHAAALFDRNAKLISLKEDVGRHNALDKLIGFALNEKLLPLNKHLILLSGRISFELVQKAIMANCKILIAIGAPSSFAINLATQYNLTLIGFLKENSFNIYSSKNRIAL